MKLKYIILALLLTQLNTKDLNAQNWSDFANTSRYEKANLELKLHVKSKNRVVFMGNSITEGWVGLRPEYFKNKDYINRGISGQTTPQMLLLFRQDVIALQPKVVVILAGTNDIAGNTGPSSLEMIADNIKSMAELAKAHGIKVVISSTLPAYDYPWRPGLEPNIKIPKLNAMIKRYAEASQVHYLDYFNALDDGNNGIIADYTYDGVHLTSKGYRVMEPMVEKALKSVLNN